LRKKSIDKRGIEPEQASTAYGRYCSAAGGAAAGRNLASLRFCYARPVHNPAGEPCMANIQSTPSRLVLKDGSTSITFDKTSGYATLQQKILLWKKKPVEFPIDEIDDIAVKSETDGISGAPIFHSVMHRKSGAVTVLTTEEAQDAEATVKTLREFVGLH
jgi:hypothetical protein